MKKSSTITLTFGLLVAMFASAWMTSPRAQEKSNAAPKWEYKVELLQSDKENEDDEVAHIEKQLNALGEQGWELAEMQLRAAIFKRPKQ